MKRTFYSLHVETKVNQYYKALKAKLNSFIEIKMSLGSYLVKESKSVQENSQRI